MPIAPGPAPTPWLQLRRPEALSPGVSLALRALLVLGLISVALAGHWFDRDGLRDNTDGTISFLDVVYFTAITVTTVGYGDIVPVTDQARMFDTFVVTPIRLFIWLIFLGTAYDFIFRRLWDRWRMSNIQRTLAGHDVVCGFGRSGEAAFVELTRAGNRPEQIVVVDLLPERIDAAIKCGATGLVGDATQDAVLEAARIGSARSVLVCTGRDDSAALVVLSARQLAPRTVVCAIVKSEENERLVRQAGATAVVNPSSIGGQLLARATGSARVVDYVVDLVGNDGRVCLRERAVTPDEVGRPLASLRDGLGVRIYRGDRIIGFWEPDAKTLAAGDAVVEIVPLAESLRTAS